jgi:cytochrome P450
MNTKTSRTFPSVLSVLAGHETTSTLMTWTIYCLTQNPVVLLKLQKEIDSVLRGEPPTAETLSKLTYTEAVLKETLRLYTPVPNIIRQTICDNTIVTEDGKKIFVKKGTEVVIDFYTMHQ